MVYGGAASVVCWRVIGLGRNPFTLIVIMPTSKKLLDPALDRGSDLAHRLLQDWGKFHAVRSILALAASVIFLSSLIWP
jgi:uncharacterized membrane protein